jgi:two-component system, OmpR family, phosphate regulon sensor histidine kinase PhoR
LPLQELVEQAREVGQVLNSEFEPPGQPQRVLGVNASALMDRNGEPQGVILVFHDLTRIKQLENTRKDFVANVSHELRTPLSMIKGYVETLLDGAKDDPVVAARFLQTIRKHTDRLAFLIEDLLTISQLESGRSTLNLKRFPLRPLVDGVFTDLQTRAMEKRMGLHNEMPPDLETRADADRIQQVLFNLVDNAIKYGPTNGQVRITGEPVDQQQVRISVQDDGVGIPPEARERVFERFYRVDRARSREEGGTGLGLAIVKHIIQHHGGEVWVESEPGRGATFCFTLPGGNAVR